VIRALAQPEILEYEQTEELVNAPIYVPCAADAPTLPEPDKTAPYLSITPACANEGEIVQVEGFNFAPDTEGPLRFIPGSDPNNNVALGRDNVKTDSNGHFIFSITLPKRASAEVQYLRATLRHNIGTPHFTKTAADTWEKIVETVFLALLATTFGTFLAIPLSFIAARNLMKPVKSPLSSISLSILGWVVGMAIGFLIVRGVEGVSALLGANVFINFISIVITPLLAWVGIRWALPHDLYQSGGRSHLFVDWAIGRMVVSTRTTALHHLGTHHQRRRIGACACLLYQRKNHPADRADDLLHHPYFPQWLSIH